MRHDNDDDDDAGEEEEEDDDIQDEADRGFLTHAHGSLLASSLSGGGGLESTSSGAGAKVIVHLDMDAFYAQVECGIDPSLKGKPVAVVQYAPSGNLHTLTVHDNRRVDRSNQSLIAVSYEARARGVKRIMLGDQARAVCPDIILVQVCVAHKKADLTIYREAGAKVIKIFARYGPTERASIDEAYVDLTAAAQARLKDFGPKMIARARRGSKLAGLEGQEGQASLSREDVRNGVIAGAGMGGGGGGKEGVMKEDEDTKKLLLSTSSMESGAGDVGNSGVDSKPAPPATSTCTSSSSTSSMGAEQQEPSTSTSTTTSENNRQQPQQQPTSPTPSSPPSPSPITTTRAAAAWWDRPLHAWTRSEKEMVCGATILSEMRAAVTAELGYTCSGGLAPSKLLAKLGSAMHKPNQQTLIVQEMVPILLAPLPVSRLKGLGGDFGKKLMEDLGCSTIGEVVQTPLARLQALYGDSDADWLFKLVRGVDGDTVEDRRLAKSVSCGKTFYGHNNLRSMEQVHTWLRQLAGELTERLRKDADLHARIPQLLAVSFQSMGLGGQTQNVSRSAPLRLSIEQLLSVEVGGAEAVGSHSATAAATGGEGGGGSGGKAVQESLAEQGLSLVRRWHKQQMEETPHLSAAHHALCLATLYLTAGNFLEIKQKSRMTSFFTKADPAASVAASTSASGSAAAAAAGGGGGGGGGGGASPSLPTLLRTSSTAAASQTSSSSSIEPFFKNSTSQRTLTTSQQQQDDDTLKRKGDGSTSEAAAAGGAAAATAGAAATAMAGIDPGAIDPVVLAELPLDIRNEIIAGMAAAAATSKRAKTNAAAPSSKKIENYFQKGGGSAAAQPRPAPSSSSSSSSSSASSAKKGALEKFLKTKK